MALPPLSHLIIFASLSLSLALSLYIYILYILSLYTYIYIYIYLYVYRYIYIYIYGRIDFVPVTKLAQNSPNHVGGYISKLFVSMNPERTVLGRKFQPETVSDYDRDADLSLPLRSGNIPEHEGPNRNWILASPQVH